MDKITDYKDFNKTPYILSQFQESNFISVLEVADTQYNELETVFYDLLTLTTIKNATGAQLDIIGVDVGVDRMALSDANYRVLIYSQILTNTGSGTPEDLYNFISAFLGGTNSVIYPLIPAKVSVFTDTTYTIAQLQTYLQNLIPAGILLAIGCYVIDEAGDILITEAGEFVIADY